MPLSSISLRFTCSATSSLSPSTSNGRTEELITRARYDSGAGKCGSKAKNFFSVVYIYFRCTKTNSFAFKGRAKLEFPRRRFSFMGFGSICRSNGVESTSQNLETNSKHKASIKSKRKLFNFSSLRMLFKHHSGIHRRKKEEEIFGRIENIERVIKTFPIRAPC